MSRILTITLMVALAALMLAGCADGYDRSAGINDCKRASLADRPVSQVNLGNNSTFESSLAGIPGQGVPGGTSERLAHGASASKCVQDNNGTKPRATDLQKIGTAQRNVLSL